MGCLQHTAFWTASFACSFMMLAIVLPLWLGRMSGGVLTFWGLWYRLDCRPEHCLTYGEILKSQTLPELSLDIDVVIITVLAMVSIVFCFVGILVLEIISCRSRLSSVSPRRLLVGIGFLFLISAVFGFVAFIVACYLCDKFYEQNMVNMASEFPWSVLLYAIGVLLVIIAAILYFVITCNWYKYGDYYSNESWYVEEYVSEGQDGKYYRNNSYRTPLSITESFRKSGAGVSNFSGSGYERTDYGRSRSEYGRSRSEYGKSRAESSYFDFRLSKPHKSLSATDLRSSRKSIHDSPKILRHTTVGDYLSEELRSSRIVPVIEEDRIDPVGLTTGYTAYRDSNSRDKSSAYTAEPLSVVSMSKKESSLLDDLYRASRRSDI